MSYTLIETSLESTDKIFKQTKYRVFVKNLDNSIEEIFSKNNLLELVDKNRQFINSKYELDLFTSESEGKLVIEVCPRICSA